MRIRVPNYTFNKTAKTITFTDYVSITLESVLLITNVTDGITIYQFNEPTLGGTVASNVLTLEYDTSAMDNADDLQIWYDDPNATQEVSATNLDIRDLSQASDSVAIYGSDDGGTTKRIIKTDAGGAIQVDLEVANVTVTSSALPTGASTLAEQQTQTASLSVLDDWDESDRAKVNIIAGQAGVAGGSGSVSASTQRVVLATDVALPAGTNNIGDVDVLTLPALATGDNSIGRVKITDGTTVATVRELGANDAMNVAIVDGSGNQITSFGGGTQYAEDSALGSTPTGTLQMMRRDDTLSTLTPVEDDAVSARTNARGAQWVALDTTVVPPVQGDVAHDAVDSGNPVKVGYKAKNYGSLPTAVADADRAGGYSDKYGAPFVNLGSSYVRIKNLQWSSDQTNAAVITAGASEIVRVYSITINIDYDTQSVQTVTVGFGATTTPTTDGCLFDNQGIIPGVYSREFKQVCGAAGEDVRITTTGYTAGVNSVTIEYDIITS